jgi:ketosteroid isomerase-like protein
MKSVSPVLAFVALLAFATLTNAQEKSAEQAVRKLVADFAEAINRSEIKSFAALFTEDADFVVTTGKYLKGRNEIATILSYRIGMTRSCRN